MPTVRYTRVAPVLRNGLDSLRGCAPPFFGCLSQVAAAQIFVGFADELIARRRIFLCSA